MSKRERLHLSRYQSIETYRHSDTRVFIAYSGGCSAMFCDRKELVRWLKVPKSIPMRASLDSWLDSLEAADQERVSKSAQPLTSKAPVQQTSPSLSQELLATGFGPECHDEEDPTANTRVII
jgi:hypothetical protein